MAASRLNPVLRSRAVGNRRRMEKDMSDMPDRPQRKSILLVGASRGLGEAMARVFVQKSWHVVGTVRGDGPNLLRDLARDHPEQVEVERLDITDPTQIAALGERLAGRVFDILFVNAGITNDDQSETIAETSTEEFVRVMVTNVLGVMRTVEGLQNRVRDHGLIGVMSSGQGSIANNEKGGHEVYRGSKAALNQYMRSYAARHASDGRALVLMAPGWIRTGLGGPDAPFGIEETIPELVDTLLAQQGRAGCRFIDRHGETVPW
ncbi:SDR family oxidoreductase [Sphingomonas sp.]|jgi:NAD(P)-dependent dehydrogenase (short-subunit alcohol dehydrogenase family)|uniref:SDR family oxidoreductase n=2 Tax=Sphingomonas TaxID=13687 RepID=UPI00286EE4C6|nr:SDR family oxidoreductase [Sphingomonas sp.]